MLLRGRRPLNTTAARCGGAAFFASPAMQSAQSHTLLRSVLARSLATILFSCSQAYAAGFAFGSAIHRLNQQLSSQASALLAPDHQLLATISAWEEEVATGRWVEPTPVERLFSSSWWDLIDPSELDEAEQELPLRWAV